MKGFFKYLLASIFGVLIGSLILFFIFLGIFGAIANNADKPVEIKENTVLHVKLNKIIMDRANENPFGNADFMNFNLDPVLGLNDILDNIKKAKVDDNIKGIFLDISIIPANLATIEEIRNALIDFKESGKFIIAHGDVIAQTAYYLGSVADKIYITPTGILEFAGMRAERMFFTNALKKIGVKPEIIRHGRFKSAVEPFMLNEMSKENRMQTQEFINSFWGHMLTNLSEARNLTIDELNALADDMTGMDVAKAAEAGLIDGIKYKDEIYAEINENLGKEVDSKINTVSLDKYTRVPKNRESKGLAKDKVAVIYAMGEILMGNSQDGTIGSETISEAIRKARKDKNIKAIVFRINSGGGSALASEVILREAKLAAKEKPFIVSFGDVAASGGYYIACAADTIVASPNTITGSIGVFGLFFTAQELLNDKIGVNIDVVKTNKLSDFGNIGRPMSQEEKDLMQHFVSQTYKDFITHVANGRGLTTDQVDEIGEGRVWSGQDAIEIGLVDVLGGLDKAIEIAVEKAGLTEYRVTNLPKQKDPLTQLMEELSGDAAVKFIKNELGYEYQYLIEVRRLMENQGVMARMPYDIKLY